MAVRPEMKDLTPERIVRELDAHIVGQGEAKRTVAIAMRNRWRRMQLEPEVAAEVSPKNIMLIGPTGVGKTEIARRLAALTGAPFVKVEATRFTEVGYVGRDVESMVRDLVEISVGMVKQEEMARVRPKAVEAASDRLVDLLAPRPPKAPEEERAAAEARYEETRRKMAARLASGDLDERTVEVQVEEKQIPFLQVFSGQGMEEVGFDAPGSLGSIFGPKKRQRKSTVKEARRILEEQEAEKLIDRERVTREGMERAEQMGVVFIDEIDKVVSAGRGAGPDVSREGVQRDLLPIVEGATVVSRYGPVKTDHMLFIAAGAFSKSKPTDLIPELQGRFPLRAELKGLGREDFVRILREPKNAMLTQARVLLETEGVHVEFTPDGVEEMARFAAEANTTLVDIGARRLHTIVERVLDEVSFEAPKIAPTRVVVNAGYVTQRLAGLWKDEDLRKYIL